MPIIYIDSRNPDVSTDYKPITRSSFDKQHVSLLHYQITAQEVFLSGQKKPKGIIIQSYSATDDGSVVPNELAKQGYVVCFVRGHDLNQQASAAGVRSVIRDVSYFALLLKGTQTLQQQIDILLEKNAHSSTLPILMRAHQKARQENNPRPLSDYAGQQLLANIIIDDTVPIIMNGQSQGGQITLDIASNLEGFDCHFTLHSATQGPRNITFFAQRYDNGFDAFVAEAPWFKKEEIELHREGSDFDIEHYATSGSHSRMHALSNAQQRSWMSDTADRLKGMEHLDARTVELDPMGNASNIRKPVLLIQNQWDDNTPIIFTAQFAKKLLKETNIYLSQFYYDTQGMPTTTSHFYPQGFNEHTAGYFSAINLFIHNFQTKSTLTPEEKRMNFDAASTLSIRASWDKRDPSHLWSEINTLTHHAAQPSTHIDYRLLAKNFNGEALFNECIRLAKANPQWDWSRPIPHRGELFNAHQALLPTVTSHAFKNALYREKMLSSPAGKFLESCEFRSDWFFYDCSIEQRISLVLDVFHYKQKIINLLPDTNNGFFAGTEHINSIKARLYQANTFEAIEAVLKQAPSSLNLTQAKNKLVEAKRIYESDELLEEKIQQLEAKHTRPNSPF